MINIDNKKNCAGCSACKSICPKKCISMKEDSEGFLYPCVDKSKCIDCGLCEKVCPIKNKVELSKKTTAIAVQNLDYSIRKESTSGGMFYALSKMFIEKYDGIVVGAGFNENAEVIHKIIDNSKELKELIGSKYVQSDLNSIFIKINELSKEHKVLFCGTPCQVAGLKMFMKDNPQIYYIDLVCYGVPSPKVYDIWKKNIELKYNSKVKKVFFRDKKHGFSSPNVKILFGDGSEKDQTSLIKTYMKLFMNDLTIRPSCTNCKFKGIQRCSDITLGDCWSIGKFDKKYDDNIGTTSVFVHSDRGRKLIKEIEHSIRIIEIDCNKEVEYDGKKIINSATDNLKRKDFLENVTNENYFKMFKKYSNFTLKERIVTYSKKVLGGNKIFNSILKKLKSK